MTASSSQAAGPTKIWRFLRGMPAWEAIGSTDFRSQAAEQPADEGRGVAALLLRGRTAGGSASGTA